MDIKDLIKWLFQVKSPHTNKRTAPSEPKNASRMYLILATTAILLSFVTTSDANDSFFDASTLQHANLKNKLQDTLIEGQTFKFRIENGNETKTNEQRQNRTESNVKNSNEESSISGYSNENSSHTSENGIFLTKNNGNDLIMQGLNQFKLSAVSASVFRVIDGSVAYLGDLLGKNMGSETARTFGRPLRKLQSALLPIMFKLGVIATLIFLTFLLSLKAVAIGLLLLVFKMAGIIATFKAGLVSHHGYGHGHGHEGWSPHKEVHLHIHNSGHGIGEGGHEGAYYPTTGFDPWSRQDTIASPTSLVQRHPQPALYPSVASYPAAQAAGPGSINTPYGHYVRTGGPTAPGYSK